MNSDAMDMFQSDGCGREVSGEERNVTTCHSNIRLTHAVPFPQTPRLDDHAGASDLKALMFKSCLHILGNGAN